MKTSLILAALGVATVLGAAPATPDLQKISEGRNARIAGNAAPRWEKDVKGKPALFSRGAIWLDGVNFREGTIECDILGKSTPRGSNFLGIAFHGKDDATFECVYFRPFNFRAENPENSSHAVQYISHPQWTWQKLRAEKTGQYEKPILPPLDGDGWFRAKIVVTARKVSVFVNDAARPSLEVDRLSDQADGKIAIWGGDAGEGGYFANLKITPKE
ncbi:MAG TPA: hypothetical protein VM029_06720 [Opitutaceae bacterium]|nr:hypothetical protein [Opitutaceae bacterium]